MSGEIEDENKVLRMYRKQRDLISDHKETLIDPSNEHLLGIMINTDEIFEEVKSTSGLRADAAMVHSLSQLTVRQAEAIGANIFTFRPEVFAQKLVDKTGQLSRNGLVRLGQTVKPLFRRSPVLTYMLGSVPSRPVYSVNCGEGDLASIYRREEKEPNIKRGKENVVNKKREEYEGNIQRGDGDITNIQREEGDIDEGGNGMYEKLLSSWMEAGKVPVEYFRFVLDPNCFGTSVENMFHFSFLVKDGRVKLEVDSSTKLPMVSPVEDINDNLEKQSFENQAVVIKFSMEDWRRMVECSTSPPCIKVNKWKVDEQWDKFDDIDSTSSASEESTLSAYMKRHEKMEKEEKRIIRWDQQSERERLRLEHLRTRCSKKMKH